MTMTMTPAEKSEFQANGEQLINRLDQALSEHPDVYSRSPAWWEFVAENTTQDQLVAEFRRWLYDAETVEDAERWTANIQRVLVDVQNTTDEDVSNWPSWHALVQTVTLMANRALQAGGKAADVLDKAANNPGTVLFVLGAGWLFLKGLEAASRGRAEGVGRARFDAEARKEASRAKRS